MADKPILTKICSDCEQELPIHEFYVTKDNRTGRSFRYARCKKCLAKRRLDIATGKIIPHQGKHYDPEKLSKNVELDDLVILSHQNHMSYGQYMAYLYKTEGHYC